MKAKLLVRQHDKHGAGYYKAPRGSRLHNGIDYAAPVGLHILPIREGLITKLGYPYGDDNSFRYVQVSADGYDFRYFYLSPLVKVNEYVYTETPIGTVQDLEPRYNGITPHCHLEVKKYGQFINPEEIE
tara:strand:- start:47 stop:433 length:387 start_codon:yes stop_codon:yes gene_type:complete